MPKPSDRKQARHESKSSTGKKIEYDVVLTLYEDNGNLHFHGGETTEDFRELCREHGQDKEPVDWKVLHRFFIKGEIVKEDGLEDPIRMS